MIDLDNISFDHCIKCTVCTVYCPVARETHLYPGPKFSGPDTERLRIKSPDLYDESLKYCSNCKRCEIVCPSDVHIADIIRLASAHNPKKRLKLRDMLLSSTDLIGTVATRISGITNLMMKLPPLRSLLQLFLGLSGKRAFPEYAKGSFRQWYAGQENKQAAYPNRVVYFHGCYVNYNDPELGKAVLRIMNRLDTGVFITEEKCCGIPLISNNRMQKAKQHARHNIKVLANALDNPRTKIVLTSSSCCLTLDHEYKKLLEMDTAPIAGRIELLTGFLYHKYGEGQLPPLKPVQLKVAYHAPCHLEHMGGVVHTVGLLRKIPGLDLRLLHSECCGISGTYGFKEENYAISQAIGRHLFDQINEMQPDLVITDCETCKWQIEFNTSYRVVHPISLLAEAMGLESIPATGMGRQSPVSRRGSTRDN